MNINHNHILSLLQTGFTTVNVTFDVNMTESPFTNEERVSRARNRNQKSQQYTYKALIADNVKAGDLVVVDSPQDGMMIVQVTSVDKAPRIDLSAPFPYKWIVQKIDTARYDSLLAQEQEFKDALVEVERTKQRETVLKEFEQHLPEGSEARKMFQSTIEKAKVLPHAGE